MKAEGIKPDTLRFIFRISKISLRRLRFWIYPDKVLEVCA